MADIEDQSFRFDYLIAFLTGLFWVRCIMLLRLTESFGPLLVMVYSMVLIVLKFLIIYVVGLITFSALATLTLAANPNFGDLFLAFRTYLMASLGNFDIMQYDALPGW